MLKVNWTRTRHLFGETLREVGTLVFVFAPLEAAFAERAIRPDLLATVILGSLAAIIAGIVLESRESTPSWTSSRTG